MAVIPFQSIDHLIFSLESLGATRILCKPLTENDNYKQQIYLGSSFDVLKDLPYQTVDADPDLDRPNFKAPIFFWWTDASMRPERAIDAKLILYPDYPEVRLSGFLRGCTRAPNHLLQPIPKHQRIGGRQPDGRMLCLGITEDNNILAYLAERGGSISNDLRDMINTGDLQTEGVFFSIKPIVSSRSRPALIYALQSVCDETKWHTAQRRNADGTVCIPYLSQNASGYTLESLLKITPNGRPEPDFLGWELKVILKGSRVTLMTPQPDGGLYRQRGLDWFINEYGGKAKNGGLSFNGGHKVGELQKKTHLTLTLNGFDQKNSKIVDVKGSIELIDLHHRQAASWSFQALLDHWGRKHAGVAFIPYAKRELPPTQFQYKSSIYIGERTDFRFFLKAMSKGAVIYDPGCSVKDEGKKPKSRHQFRIGIGELSSLYEVFEEVTVR